MRPYPKKRELRRSAGGRTCFDKNQKKKADESKGGSRTTAATALSSFRAWWAEAHLQPLLRSRSQNVQGDRDDPTNKFSVGTTDL